MIRVPAKSEIAACLAFLETQPFENVLVESVLQRASNDARVRKFVRCAFDSELRPLGVAIFGQTIRIAHMSAPTARLFANEVHHDFEALIGPVEACAGFESGISTQLNRRPSVDVSRFVFALDRTPRRPPCPDGASLHVARYEDRHDIVASAASLIESELGYDPRRRQGFARDIVTEISRGRWYVVREAHSVRFVCRVGAKTPRTTVLECVVTREGNRGRGYATYAVSEICRELLMLAPTVTLSVAEHNAVAQRLYRKLGFVQVGTQRAVVW